MEGDGWAAALEQVADGSELLKLIDDLERVPVTAAFLLRTQLPNLLQKATQRLPAAQEAGRRLRAQWRGAFERDTAAKRQAPREAPGRRAGSSASSSSSSSASSSPRRCSAAPPVGDSGKEAEVASLPSAAVGEAAGAATPPVAGRPRPAAGAGAGGATPQKVQSRFRTPSAGGRGGAADADAAGAAAGGAAPAGAGETPPRPPAAAKPPARHLVGDAADAPPVLVGRAAEQAAARIAKAPQEQWASALAEGIMQVVGPPSRAQSVARTREILVWLGHRARRGSVTAFGRPCTFGDVKEAAKLLGKVSLTRPAAGTAPRADSNHAGGREGKDQGAGGAAAPAAAAAPGDGRPRRTRRRSRPSSSSSGSSTSSSDSESEGSDLSDEEEVDGEVAADALACRRKLADASGPPPDDGYKGDWAGAPPLGCPAFNDFATAAMRKAGVAASIPLGPPGKAVACPPLQPHQETAIFLMHPKSPCKRVLIDHPTGSGKTREMIQILDNFFYDPRPKVPIFPKEPVCRNFYVELLRWPNKYRDYFSCMRPHCAVQASCTQYWRLRREHLWNLGHLTEAELRTVCAEMREVLEMKGCFYMGSMLRAGRQDFKRRFPRDPFPGAPLRALRYTSAGGQHTTLREVDGLPASALFKIGFSQADPNVYSSKIVVMDEVHNLVRTQTQYGRQLDNLRRLLFDAKGAVVAGFTGTPILCEPQEGRRLLDILKGRSAPLGDAGFISSFHMRPASLFPRSLPAGVPDAVLTPRLKRQFVRRVVLAGESLQRYDKKRAAGLPQSRLQRYCSLCVHFGSLHDGKSGCKARVLDDLESCAPKLHAIARDVAAEPSKALVLVARSSGMDALVAHLRRLGAPEDGPRRFGVATMEELADFNAASNLRGDVYRVLVADSASCSEGVSFFAVRRVLLADVPASPSALVQSVGRAVRMYGHQGLPEDEWTVTATLYAATLPHWLRSPLAAWAFRSQRHHHDPGVARSKARRLLRKLLKAGIDTLEGLKGRLADHCARRGIAVGDAAPSSSPMIVDAEVKNEYPSVKGEYLEVKREDPNVKHELPEVKRECPDVKSVKAEFPEVKRELPEVKNEDMGLGVVVPGQPGKRAPRLAPDEVVAFMEAIGLRDEAKLIGIWASENQKKRKAHKQAPRRAGAAEGQGAPAAAPRAQHWMARALEHLLDGETAEQVTEEINLSPFTADELALKDLSAASRALVPALRELRRAATDREVLESLVGTAAPQCPAQVASAAPDGVAVDSDGGESVASPFSLGAPSSGAEDGGGDGPPPLVLPPGWQVHRVRRGKTSTRQFVDPAGKVYATEAQARRAVDACRRSANVASRLRQRFSARLAASAGAGEGGAAAACLAPAGPWPAEKRHCPGPGGGAG